MAITIDDVLLKLEAEVREEAERNPDRCLFVDLEADAILKGRVLGRDRAKFARICQDLGLTPAEGAVLDRQVKWLG